MKNSEILEKLRNYKARCQGELRFTKIGVFGSVARGASLEKCGDIDIVVELKEPDLFLLGSIKTDLEEEFGKKVDIIRLRKGMNALLKKRIDQDAVYV